MPNAVLAIVDNREYGRDIQDLELPLHRAARDRERGQGIPALLRAQKRRLGCRQNLMRLLGIGSLAVEDFRRLQAHYMA